MSDGVMTVGELVAALQRLDPDLSVWTKHADLAAPLKSVVVTTAGDAARDTMEGDPSGPKVVVLTNNDSYESPYHRWKARGFK